MRGVLLCGLAYHVDGIIPGVVAGVGVEACGLVKGVLGAYAHRDTMNRGVSLPGMPRVPCRLSKKTTRSC